MQFATVEASWHLVALKVKHSVSIDTLGVVQRLLKLCLHILARAGRVHCFLLELTKELGDVERLDAITE